MTLQAYRTIRLAVGVTTAVAVSYAFGWTLSYVAPIFTFMFLAMPGWMGGKMAVQLLLRLGFALLIGIFISEFLLTYPLLCIPAYGLLFFLIYYNDTPASPPLSTLFMTLGITLIPIVSFMGAGVAPMIAFYLLFTMGAGIFFAWIFHTVLPDSRFTSTSPSPVKKPPPKPVPELPPESERIRLAMVSTIVALTAVIIFFSFNLAQHALAMIYICIMVGTPQKNASIMVTKMNTLATTIGGIAVIIAFNLLVAVPTYQFLVCLTLLYSLLFSHKIYQGGPKAAAFSSGFTTFLVLLGSSTGVDKSAASNYYLRLAQVLFAGFFTIFALMIVEQLLRPSNWRFSRLIAKFKSLLPGAQTSSR